MSKSPEIVGSMPSMPQHKPLQHKPMPANSWVFFVGFLLCAVCLLGFPKYANTDNLGTGIFDGMGLIVLLLAFTGLCRGVARRVGRNRAPKAAEAGSSSDVLRRKRRPNGIGVGLLFLLFGGFLLAFPQGTSMEAFSRGIFYGMGLIVLLIAIMVLSSGVSRHITRRVSPG